MTEHHLHNVRPIPAQDAQCAHCGGELYRIKDLGDIYTRSPGLTFCNDACYGEWVLVYGGTNPTKIDDRRPDAHLLHAKAAEQAADLAAHNQRVAQAARDWQAANHGTDKSVVRQTGEAAANVVGFLTYLILISAIAAVIFAATGMNPWR